MENAGKVCWLDVLDFRFMDMNMQLLILHFYFYFHALFLHLSRQKSMACNNSKVSYHVRMTDSFPLHPRCIKVSYDRLSRTNCSV